MHVCWGWMGQSVDELEEQLQLIKKRSRVDARLHWVLRKLSNEQSALARTRQMLQAIAGHDYAGHN